MQFDFEYVSKLLQALTLAVLPVLAAQLAAILSKRFALEKGKLTEQQQGLLMVAINTFVFAAEQIYGAGNGDQKKRYALDMAEKWLADHKLNIDLDIVLAEIEAAVKMNFDNSPASRLS